MDFLVKLYALPESIEKRIEGVSVRRAFAAEKHLVVEFVARSFSAGWASECGISFARLPVACFVAMAGNTICGFACYDATTRGFFGPIGVAPQWRHRGIGSTLLLSALHDMRANGYGYAIIGAASDGKLYRAVGAVEIAGSSPGFYSGLLKTAD
ncbi:MAG TPA: GNAT family N-acetyltransferase [Chthoniobacterales bacterium]|jgi:ribosomal protein S18 acetylase RimI-like enzyme